MWPQPPRVCEYEKAERPQVSLSVLVPRGCGSKVGVAQSNRNLFGPWFGRREAWNQGVGLDWFLLEARRETLTRGLSLSASGGFWQSSAVLDL